MIDELRICDVALIRDASITFSPGLTVLTGETGAGKTALLGALKLVVGERGDAGLVREGAQGLAVEGRFFLEQGDEDGCVVRRRLTSDGRGRVEIDGRMASVRELAQVVGGSVDLCGQHEHQRLLSVSTHVEMLDAWAHEQVGPALDAYREAFHKASAAREELARITELSRASAARFDEAEFTLRRIDEVSPRAGELEELEETLPLAEHAEALIMAAEAAREAIAGDDGAADAISSAARALRDASRHDRRLASFADTLESALIDIEDVASELRDYRDEVEFDPEELDRMQTRLSKLQGLLRAFGPHMEDVLAARDAAAEIVEAAGDGGARELRAKKALAAAERELAMRADALDAARAEAAPRLSESLGRQMARLEMGSAAVEFLFERLPRAQWTSSGPSRVELMYRPGAELSARPLRRIASGGEVSRVMLAAKVALGEADDVETLVFDEVDAGVGGATAVALAEVLSDLATTHQVIVVTHLAQVAVRADSHYVVQKTGGDDPQTLLREVSGDERVHEIARMLSGDTSQASLAHAREMLRS